MPEYNVPIPYNYAARDYQLDVWEASASFKRLILIWHRRAGKEKTCFNILAQKAFEKIGTYFYIFPEFAQGRKILWDGMDKSGFKFIDHIPKEVIKSKNSAEMKLTLANGSMIQVVGSNNVDSIMGTNPIGCVFSEYSLQDPIAWQLIRPILVENGGWALFNGTPRGKNHLYDLYSMASDNPDWFTQLLTVEDTGVISLIDIQKERDAGMSEDFIQQEFYCSFTLGIAGSYYAKYLQDAKDEGRIGNVRWDTQKQVHTAWDIGIGDSAAIIFYQIIGQEVHIIDHYENSGEGFAHYAQIIKDKPYLYGDHFGPHDIDSRDFTSGLSVKSLGHELGIKFITLPTLKIKVEDGIEAVRGIFSRVWIDSGKCGHLIKCLENYKKIFDSKMQVYKDRPHHDWSSHSSDAMRYLSLAVRLHVDAGKAGVDDAQADRWYNKYNPVFE